MTTPTDFQTRSDTISASLKAIHRTKDGMLGLVETLRADFSEIKNYKDIRPCANAFNRVERALREAFEVIYDERDSLLSEL